MELQPLFLALLPPPLHEGYGRRRPSIGCAMPPSLRHWQCRRRRIPWNHPELPLVGAAFQGALPAALETRQRHTCGQRRLTALLWSRCGHPGVHTGEAQHRRHVLARHHKRNQQPFVAAPPQEYLDAASLDTRTICGVGVLFGYFLVFFGIFLVLVGGSLFQYVEKTASSQSVSRSAKCSVSQPVTSPPRQPASSQSVSQSSATWPASSQSVSQPASQPVSQSVNRSLRHGASQSVSQSKGHPATRQASKQSVSQSANQPASEALRSVQLSCASHYEDRA